MGMTGTSLFSRDAFETCTFQAFETYVAGTKRLRLHRRFALDALRPMFLSRQLLLRGLHVRPRNFDQLRLEPADPRHRIHR
jgi:hypothetical protein